MRRYLWGISFVMLAAACSSKPAAIEVSPRPVKIYGLKQVQWLTGRLMDKKGRPLQSGSLRWSSSKSDIVTVDNSGKLQSLKEGRSVVTASFEKLSVQVPVEVVDVKSIEIVPASAHLVGPAGTTTTVTSVVKNSAGKPTSRPITWTSSKPAVATISGDGMVTSVGPGTTTIIGRVGDLQGASEVIVTVGEIARLEIHPTTALVRVGDSQRFEIVAYAPDGKAYEGGTAVFQSSDPAVATVDAGGMASGIAPGTASIKASIAGVSAEATLLVN
jgi:trimeric autotransporter adhesin